MSEVLVKLERIQGLLDKLGLDALLLQREANFAWGTCGAASHINLADSIGAASLLYTPYGRYVITNNIEAARLLEEEPLPDQGWDLRAAPWYKANGAVAELTKGMRLGADGAYPGAADVQEEVSKLRAALVPEEVERFRLLSRSCAEAMDAAILGIRPGLTEQQIAGMVAREVWGRGVEPVVNLVGTDERISLFRHPIPTGKRLEHYAMLALCGRKWGLVASITRLAYLGRLPDELRNKGRAVAQVDAHFIAATRPGTKLREILREAMECYQLYGYLGEWELHHQGGRAGYEPREIVATPDTEEEVLLGQVYAWNPSITGVKSEDTILVEEGQNEILTTIPRWPMIKVNLRGQMVERPLILEIT
jgi:Xaa-Pro aminopeptidase